jgi:hypothetical protein
VGYVAGSGSAHFSFGWGEPERAVVNPVERIVDARAHALPARPVVMASAGRGRGTLSWASLQE